MNPANIFLKNDFQSLDEMLAYFIVGCGLVWWASELWSWGGRLWQERNEQATEEDVP